MAQSLQRRFTATRLRNLLCVSMFIAAGIAALAPIRSLRAVAERTRESASPKDDARSRVDVLRLANVTSSLAPSSRPCFQPMVFSENFDNVTPPALPPGWLATNALGPPPLWGTSNSGLPSPPADTPPNAAFIDDPAVVSDKRLDSPPFAPFGAVSAQLTFRQNFNLEAAPDQNVGFDGGVLEISTDGGNTFRDILVAGGSFVIGGYNRTISTGRGSPIAGRQAWSGDSAGFITTVVNLPFIPPGSRLRWRMASDNTGSWEGWRVDTVNISWCAPVPCQTPSPRPRPTPAPRPTPR
jgi:hypothetical protein